MSKRDGNPVENPVEVETQPGRNGGKLRKGGTNRGGTGRPPNEFKERMQGLATGAKVEAYLKRCLAGDFGPKFFLQALTYVSDRGYGRPSQSVEVTGADGAPLFKSFIGVDTDAV